MDLHWAVPGMEAAPLSLTRGKVGEAPSISPKMKICKSPGSSQDLRVPIYVDKDMGIDRDIHLHM